MLGERSCTCVVCCSSVNCCSVYIVVPTRSNTNITYTSVQRVSWHPQGMWDAARSRSRVYHHGSNQAALANGSRRVLSWSFRKAWRLNIARLVLSLPVPVNVHTKEGRRIVSIFSQRTFQRFVCHVLESFRVCSAKMSPLGLEVLLRRSGENDAQWCAVTWAHCSTIHTTHLRGRVILHSLLVSQNEDTTESRDGTCVGVRVYVTIEFVFERRFWVIFSQCY